MKLGTDLIRATDPVSFALDVSGFKELDPWQRDVLTSANDRIILNLTRQGGKSAIAALKGLHRAVYGQGSLVLLLSPSMRQSSEIFQKVHDFYRPIAREVPCRRETALRMELRNGSRIISLPGKEATIRGYSGVDLLIVDEASRVPDDVYNAVRPMLAVSNGSLILLSTPFGRRGFYYSVWEHGEEWLKVKFTAEQCPRISEEFLKRERRTMPRFFYKQEYECGFEESEASVFDWQDVEDAAQGEVEQWKL